MIEKSLATLESASSAPSEPSPPPYDAAQERALGHLQRCAAAYQEAERQGVREFTEVEARNLVSAMRDVGDSHSNPKVKSDWYSRAKRFAQGEKTDRQGILNEIGGIVQLALLVPRLIIGTAAHIVGNTVRKVGWAVVGLGDSVVRSSRANVVPQTSREDDKRRGADQLGE